MDYSFRLPLLLLTFLSLSVHCSASPIIQAANVHNDPNAYYNCTRNITFATSTVYRSNVKTLLDWLSSNSTNNARYYNTTVTSKTTGDTVYGLFVCRRDIPDPKICELCVIKAAKLIQTLCTTATEAIIWYHVCHVRYSDRRFFSTMEESPKISFMNTRDYADEVGRFSNILWDLLNDLKSEATNACGKWADKSVNITERQKLYGSASCVPYLSKEDCSWCLHDAIAEISAVCCRGKSGGRVIYPSCSVRYEIYPFFLPNATWVPPPSLPTSPLPSSPPGKGRKKTPTIILIIVPIVVSLVLLAMGCSYFLGLNVRRSSKELPEEFFISMKILASK